MGCTSNKKTDNSKNENSDDISSEDDSKNKQNNKNTKNSKKKSSKKQKNGKAQHEYDLYPIKNITQKIYTNNPNEIIPNSPIDQNQPKQFWSFIDKDKQKKYPIPKDDLQIFEEHQKEMKFIRPLKRDQEFKKRTYLVEYEVYGSTSNNTRNEILKNRRENKYKKNIERNFVSPNGEGYKYYAVGRGPEDEKLEKKKEMEKINEEEKKESEEEVKKSNDEEDDDILKAVDDQPKQEEQENDNDF